MTQHNSCPPSGRLPAPDSTPAKIPDSARADLASGAGPTGMPKAVRGIHHAIYERSFWEGSDIRPSKTCNC